MSSHIFEVKSRLDYELAQTLKHQSTNKNDYRRFGR